MFFDERIGQFKIDVSTSESAIKIAADDLYNRGIVKKDFFNKVMERENEYPTGLNVGKFGVAIPHTDSQYVNRSQIEFVSFKNPVKFKNMGNISEEIDVNFIFMLAMSQPHEQTEVLSKLMDKFLDEDFMLRLKECETKEEYESILKEKGLI